MSDLLRFTLYAALFVAAVTLGLLWVLAFVVVWAIDAVVAARRGEMRPPFRIPRRAADERIGRTAIAFVLLLLGLAASLGTDPGEDGAPAPDQTVAAETAPATEADPTGTAPAEEAAAARQARARRARALRARRAHALRIRRARALRIRRARALRIRRERAARLRRERAEERRAAERERQRVLADAAPPPAEESAPGGGCAPGYSPCVPPYPPDVDCGDLSGPVAVAGPDPHGLDADGDGDGCEAN